MTPATTLTDLEQQLCDTIAARREEMIRTLADHVAIPTGMNNRMGLDLYRNRIADQLKQLGAAMTLVPGTPRPDWLQSPGGPSPPQPRDGDGASDNDREQSSVEQSIPATLVAEHKSNAGTSRVLIAGHLDTVFDPEGGFREMTILDDGRIANGPGVVDMKGGVLITLVALETLAAHGIDLNWTLLLNSDEETGSFHSDAALRDAAAKHDIGIAVEPALADGSLAIERMGSGQFKIEVFGRSAHAGREFEKGVSAVTTLGEILVALGNMADVSKGMIVNVGPLQGGAVTNAVPDYAACWGNVRYATPEAGEQMAEMIESLATDDSAMPRVVVHRKWNRPAKPSTDAVARFADVIRATAEDLGQSLPFAKTGGVCDGNIMQAAGLPTLDTLGVRGGNLHRTDEFIELDSLVERAQLLAVLLARIADGRVTVDRSTD